MECRDRNGQIIAGGEAQDAFLERLYGTTAGRALLKILIKPWVSRLGGAVLSTKLSSLAVPKFIRNNKIDMSQYESRRFHSYNDFFTRKIKDGRRPINQAASSFIAPCDSRLTVHEICDGATFHIKSTEYTMESLLRNNALAEEYRGGLFLLFRLTVDDYHRYCYADNGIKSCDTYIKGLFHTVNPLAGQAFPIYKENAVAIACLKPKISVSCSTWKSVLLWSAKS